MPAYYSEERGYWVANFYVNGKKKFKGKFPTKKAAEKYIAEQKLKEDGSVQMPFSKFCDLYFEDKAGSGTGSLKERTVLNKKYMIERHVLPYFGDMPMDRITTKMVLDWQKQIQEKGYSECYERMLNNQVFAIIRHCVMIYGLSPNPIANLKRIGRSSPANIRDRSKWWEMPEYLKFIGTIDKENDKKYYLLFELLFYLGIRIGECLALTIDDFDFENGIVNIDKTYFRDYSKGSRDMITEPKTENSVRKVYAPDFLMLEAKEYIESLYEYPRNERIFPMTMEAVRHKFNRQIEKAGVRKITIHGVRHSSASVMVNNGVPLSLIKDRLGHTSTRLIESTYGHVYDSEAKKVANLFSQIKDNCNDEKKED